MPDLAPEIKRISRHEARAGARRAAEVLARVPAVRLVFLFGSAVFDEGTEKVRDADVAVLMRPEPDPEAWRRIESNAALAAKIPLDLVPLHRAGVVLAREVAATGRCLFARTPEEETDFVIDANRRYLDFKPYLDEQYRIAAERAALRAQGMDPTGGAHGLPD